MSDNYVSLHNHTVFSLTHSIIKPIDLFERANELGQPAIAVTDSATLAAAWDCLKASKKTGVKLIMGCEFHFVDSFKEGAPIRHIILLAKNHIGYKNILLANKLANDNATIMFGKVFPRIDWNILEKCSDGVICTTACGGGILSKLINTRQHTEAFEQAKRLKGIFGDSLAFEIQPHAMTRNATPYNDYEDQRLVNRKLVQFGDELGVKVIAATDAHYLHKDQWEAHDTLLAIGSGMPVSAVSRLKYTAHDFYVKSREEVHSFLFRYFKERADEFCDNTLFFADMCEKPEWIDPKYSNPSGIELPTFPVKNQPDYMEYHNWLDLQSNDIKGKNEDVSYLRYCCEKEFAKLTNIDNDLYRARIEKELDVFEYKDLCSYILIVSDYVNWAKNNGIPVGPGRGSFGGSYIGYLLNMHNADSLKYGLVFERFYNKQKTGISDIDMDFGQKGKPLVEQYIAKKYGEEYCAKVSNFGTLTPKPYAKYITKAYRLGGGDSKSTVALGNAIADSIPLELHTVAKLVDNAPLFAEYAKVYPQLAKFADTIGNIIFQYSTHAGAIVIGKRPLVEIVPLRRTKEGDLAIEYEKDRTEENGLAKMDILGVSTLDIIDEIFKLIKARGKVSPSITWDYDANDEKTYNLIGAGNTYGVFQFGKSAGTIQLCMNMKPKNIEDLAMINSMARPGFPKEIRNDFIEAKRTNTVHNVIHESLKRSLEPTLGFALFDEVLLNLAQDVAGWDLAEADRLRKFIKEKGKNRDKDKKLKEDFISSTINNGIDIEMANRIWDEVVGNFGAYIFNKSHAIFYSFLAYQTAYLKAHFPVEFLICNLIHEDNSNAQTSSKKKQIIKKEIRALGIKICPPSINKSNDKYTILDDSSVLTGFNSLKYMGKDGVPEILNKRPFKSFEDFLSKVDGKKVRVTAVQALAASGCLDGFGQTRKEMFLYAYDYKKKLQVWNKKQDKLEATAIKSGEQFVRESFNYPWPSDVTEWTMAEKYAQEVYYMGEGFCCGFNDAYPGFFNNWAIEFSKLPEIFPEPEDTSERYFISAHDGIVQGVIMDYFEFKVKNEKSKIFGETMAKIDIEDPYGGVASMTLFPSGLERFNERLRALSGGKIKLEPGIAIHCAASANWYEGDISLVFDDLKKVAPIPPRPSDLKHHAVATVKAVRAKRVKSKKLDPDAFLEQIEEELIEEGHSDMFDVE